MPGLGLGLGLSVRRGSGPAIIVLDTFTRADNASALGTSDSGHAWTAHAGTWGISSNQGYDPVPTSNGCATVPAGVANCTVKATVSASVGGDFGITMRFTDTSNFWRILYSGGTAFFQKCVAGSFTSFNAPGWTLNVGDVFILNAVANVVTATINATQIGQQTDAFNNSATRAGLFTGNNGDATTRWDNFTVTVP